ncbi:hypothetical protein [Microbacterium azadirachtae]|uniref:Serine/arginine repetitive matrix protein 2 n=1 Tax=Microbacterium azadirachtae TaxID=582680 RepID=A0A1I6G9U3_9MICO|nr:hypothetical protein [Microbacterium azadirachtae]SDL38618.1 hypothetical protein SAMN04488593_0922 [Microbacterium azadirachtae]SEF69594.1 hypothetical protein SAMN04488594_0911 [Microbacterium azadirachtae]SEF70314.1 hypothetical protein SAMN04488592_0920 [Microbacterium azadirachtae]SFR38954.1 hypothetical protein SAMN04488591_0924 [Microbacterium azadirachtae]
MTKTNTRIPDQKSQTSGAQRGFEHSEGLRTLLIRLHEEGRWEWRHDPEVAALMRHAARKYAALARRHGLDPWEAAAAAFDAMRTGSVRRAEDPWAVITRAVQVTCIAEERANGLLCSVHQARRPKYSAHHDAERFSDRETPLTDYHPAFRTIDPSAVDGDEENETVSRVEAAVSECVTLFRCLGWPLEMARSGIEYIVTRLAESSSRMSAFESLRRDYHARAFLDLPSASWLTMLRVVLGSPDPNLAHTRASRGILHRLVSGEPLEALLLDAGLVAEVLRAVPAGGEYRGCQ